jgi:hypothetical protein
MGIQSTNNIYYSRKNVVPKFTFSRGKFSILVDISLIHGDGFYGVTLNKMNNLSFVLNQSKIDCVLYYAKAKITKKPSF